MGLTFDTGALIAIEKKSHRMSLVWEEARRSRIVITVPSIVVAEWWHGQRGPVALLLQYVTVEPLDLELARIAGEAWAKVCKALTASKASVSIADAVVMASAARRGDDVYTSDVGDLQRLQAVFPTVRLFSVSK